MKRGLAASAMVVLALATAPGAPARVLHLARIGEAPPTRWGDVSQAAGDGRRLLFLRAGPLTLRILDTVSHTERRFDLATVGVPSTADCGPADATQTILLVSCDGAGAVLLRLPDLTRYPVAAPTPAVSWLPSTLPAQWSWLGRQWVGGVSTCMKPEPVCAIFFLNYRTGAYRLGGIVEDEVRRPFDGARSLDDPKLMQVLGCERTDLRECPHDDGYAVRLSVRLPRRLDLLRSGRVVTTFAHTDRAIALRVQAGRAAWIDGSRVRLYDIARRAHVTYAVPRIGRLYLATEVVQTANRVLVAVESTDPTQTACFYVGTIPRALR